MYRKVFVAETASQLTINLPIEYLNKGVEVIAFEIDDNLDSAYLNKKKAAQNAIQFFNTLQIDMSGFKLIVTRLMRDNFFIDSNIALYLLDLNASRKKEIASSILQNIPFISPQVVFECLNVCLRKYKMEREIAVQFVTELTNASFIQAENESVMTNALFILNKY